MRVHAAFCSSVFVLFSVGGCPATVQSTIPTPRGMIKRWSHWGHCCSSTRPTMILLESSSKRIPITRLGCIRACTLPGDFTAFLPLFSFCFQCEKASFPQLEPCTSFSPGPAVPFLFAVRRQLALHDLFPTPFFLLFRFLGYCLIGGGGLIKEGGVGPCVPIQSAF